MVNQNAHQNNSSANGSTTNRSAMWKKAALLAIVVGIVVAGYRYIDINQLAEHEASLKQFQTDHPVLVYGAAFLAYVFVTGLSLPGATAMTLIMGWYFQFLRGVILVSFASTTGATIAFLLSRYLFQSAIQKKFTDQLETFNKAFDREGPFYLFTLRLIPAVPFFVINVVMGLTRISTWTYWWVSQLGMLAGTMVYTYAGSRIPDLQTLADQGAKAVFSGTQILQIGIAFTLLGIFPLVVRRIMKKFTPAQPHNSTAQE